MIRSRRGNRTPKANILGVEIDFTILLATVFECSSSISIARNAEVDLSEKAEQLRHATTAVDAKNVEKFYADLTGNFALTVVLENSSTGMIRNSNMP